MSDFLPPDGPIAAVPPLKSVNKKGEPYRRRPHVETQLGRIRPLPTVQLLPIVSRIYPESVVHLIQTPTESGAELSGQLFQEALKRARRVVFRVVSGRKSIRDDIWTDVETRLLKLLLGERSDTNLDFYEIAFSQAIQTMTNNALRSYERAPLGANRGWYPTDEVDQDGDTLEDGLQAYPDPAAGPEDIAIQRRMVETASGFVKNRRQWRALTLYYLQGLPVRSIMRKTKKTESEVWNLLKSGIKSIRRAFGVDPEEGGVQ